MCQELYVEQKSGKIDVALLWLNLWLNLTRLMDAQRAIISPGDRLFRAKMSI
jgi:hypothetical protein